MSPPLKLELDLQIREMQVDEDCKHAVAWGQKVNEKQGRSNSSNGTEDVAVAGLKTQNVIAHKPLAAGGTNAMVIFPYVFLAPRSDNGLFRFYLKTLGNVKRMFLKDKCRSLSSFTKGKIGVAMGDHK